MSRLKYHDLAHNNRNCRSLSYYEIIVREPVIGLIKWLRPKGLKVCSYVEKCSDFKNQTLKKIG